MKRTIFIALAILFLAVPFTGHSQHQYYFNEGDTIYGRDTTYHYEWWSDQWLANDSLHKLFLIPQPWYLIATPLHGKLLHYNYTEQPLNVVGIATSLYTYKISTSYWYPDDSIPTEQEYVLLYEADTSRNHFYEVGRIPFDYTKPSRYINLNLRGNTSNPCCNIAPDNNSIVKIREFYFDKPITVYDSFYIGHTRYTNWWPSPEGHSYEMGISCWSIAYASPTTADEHCNADEINCESIPLQLYRWKMDDWASTAIDSNWHYWQENSVFIEFPIIEVDSSFYDGPPQYVCPQATNFRIANVDIEDRKVILLWDTHHDHQYWQISYGPVGTAPGDGTIINCPMQVGQIMNLDTCTEYVAYVRAVCNHDSIVYSEWSDSLIINVCDTTGGGTGRIDVTSAQFVQLMPNPASEQVQVISSFGISGIEVYDLQGRVMKKTENEKQLTAQFSVSGWLPGLYIAVVHTPAGNFAKKLVVK